MDRFIILFAIIFAGLCLLTTLFRSVERYATVQKCEMIDGLKVCKNDSILPKFIFPAFWGGDDWAYQYAGSMDPLLWQQHFWKFIYKF